MVAEAFVERPAVPGRHLVDAELMYRRLHEELVRGGDTASQQKQRRHTGGETSFPGHCLRLDRKVDKLTDP
jgi:hypothetical protein